MQVKKGISPFMALVFLVAFVVVIGLLLTGWLRPFVKEKAGKTSRGEKSIRCSRFTSLEIKKAWYNRSTEKLLLQVKNTGDIELENFKLQVFYRTGSSNEYAVSPNTPLKKGERKNFFNSSINPEIEKVIFYSEECPTMGKDEIKGIKIKR